MVTACTRGRRCRRGGPRWSGEVVDEDRSGQHADRAVGAQPPVPPGSWRWRRARRGVVHALAAWCLVGVAVISTLALVIVIVFGLAAGGEKAGGLQMTIAAACLVPVSCCVLVALASPVPVGRRVRRTVGRLRPGRGSGGGRPVPNVLVGLVETLSRVEVGLGVWSGALGLALLNWVADALVLGIAVHVLVPTVGWASVVVAYAVGQFASQIPLTPGGLGFVEGGMAAALVAGGGRPQQVLAAVLVYRMVSVWIQVPIGWSCWWVTEHRRSVGRDPSAG